MRRVLTGLSIVVLGVSAMAAGTTKREVRTRNVVLGSTLPADLTSPEGKSRWHLEGLTLGAASTQTIAADAAAATVATRPAAAAAGTTISVSGADRERWLMPDRDPSQMKMGARVALEFSETRDGLADRVSAQIATIGIGWVHLPAGPKEVVLQRVLLLRQKAGELALRPDVLVHRWVSPLEGVVAQVSGPASPDGRSRLAIDNASVVEEVISGAADLKIYADQLYRSNFTDIKYGWDKGAGTLVSSIVPDPGINNVCDLLALSNWNFSGNTTGAETASTQVTSAANETCNSARCGYQGYPASGTMQPPLLERFDRNLTGTLRKDNQVVQRENRAGDVTFWLRAGTQNENKSGIFGTGETRFCFSDETGKDRNEVPVWQLPHNDARGWYVQAGDAWASAPVNSPACQETFYTLVCGATQPLTPNPLYGRACSNSGQTYAGQQTGKVVKSGVVTTPSGHTLNAMVVRNTTEFCVYSDSACTFLNDRVRTIVYFWQAPYVGALALIRSPKRVDFATGETGETPCTNFTTLDYTDFGYGLYPPLSITAGAVTDTTVQLSWNPGNDVHKISGYKVYWDTDPGANSSYAFNSVSNAGQATIVGTTATITGLCPGTTYYFTVTSLSDYTDPSSNVTTRYESIVYPTTVSGDPNFAYPVEVMTATTGGYVPVGEVTGLTVDKTTPNVHACWNATPESCVVGYDVIASDDVKTDLNWSVVGQVGLANCWDGDPGHTYLLVRARGTGGGGPWGHYNH